MAGMKPMARLNAGEDSVTPTAPPRDIDLPVKPVIELEKVTITYGRGANAVNALGETTLDIAKGDFVALVGPSGCGKSTILKLVSNLIRPSSAGARSARSGSASAWPSRIPRCCRG
jgi:NitT/TauT family transport system ATP-binding protein